jgi:FxsC-like protein
VAETEGTSVGRRVQALRRQRGWTAQQLAAECARAGMPSLTRGTLAKIESGVRKSVTAEELVALAGAFDVPPSKLLSDEPPQSLAGTASGPKPSNIASDARQAAHQGYPDPGRDSSPFFYLSYPHSPRDDQGGSDPDLWIAQLYDHLCEHIRQLADLPPGMKPGFMDRELRAGEEWQSRQTQALATCRVFVPLYSRRYFKSEYCGREWFAFTRRALNQAAKGVGRVETIVPALWIPMRSEQLPEAARSIQFNPGDFGPLYAEHGFYGIMKVSRWRDAYEEAVYRLARRIVEAAEASPVEPDYSFSFENLPSAFGGSGAPEPGDKLLRVTVIAPRRDELPVGRDSQYYGTEARDWNPYRGDSMRSLAEHAADLARSLSYTPDVGDLYQHEATLLADEPPSGPQVLLIDPWAVTQPECENLLRRLDVMDKPWVQVVVVWNQQDAQMEANADKLRAALDAALPRKLRGGRATSTLAIRGVPSLEDFGIVLSTVIAAASRQYLRHASTPSRPTLRDVGREG